MNCEFKQVDFGDCEQMNNSSDYMDQVNAHQAQRVSEEQERIAAVARLNMAPSSCGPEIVRVAPARGFTILFQNVIYSEQPDGSFKAIMDAFDGRNALRVGDAFDMMAAQSSHDLFTPEQVGMARRYRSIKERRDGSGIRCSSVEGVGGGSVSGGDYMDRVIRDGNELRRLDCWIGKGTAKAVRRVRPSDRGSRVSITDRVLFDQVCMADQCIADVLRAKGWAVNGKTVSALRAALCSMLDRMVGKRAIQLTEACHYGTLSVL
jgi:hypothetical protein